MNDIELHAGYALKSTREILSQVEAPVDIDSLLTCLSSFVLKANCDLGNTDFSDPILAVADNLISRGLPTLVSVDVEKVITSTLNIATKVEHTKTGEIGFEVDQSLSQDKKDLLYNSLFAIDPRGTEFRVSDDSFNTWEQHLGSEYEERFFYRSLPDCFGAHIPHIIESQRSIESILQTTKAKKDKLDGSLRGMRGDFYRQRVDFSFEFPKAETFESGLVIEIDGPQHCEEQQRNLDRRRDAAIADSDWAETVRVRTSEIQSLSQDKIDQIKVFLEHPYSKRIHRNHKQPIWDSPWGLEALQLSLTPFGIARIQKTLLYLISNGTLPLVVDHWDIGIIERDIPCAALAIKDFSNLLKNLFLLEGKGRCLPEIQYQVYNTDEFQKCQLNHTVPTELYSAPSNSFNHDLLIDISVLQRKGLHEIHHAFSEKVRAESLAVIRTNHSSKKNRIVRSAVPITYNIADDKSMAALTYFLKNFFRKVSFREGQIEIIKEALARKDVIGLLPTGAGKSLTYQLSALLQPGVALIVDPLKSLMKDQNDNLEAAGMDSTIFINSSLSTAQREEACLQMTQGRYQFVFISPERLLIKTFRDYLKTTQKNHTFFTYCIVDEAHCVSEWGHNFRTAYLMLGENARKHCKTYSGDIPFIALTGTASFDVLADVQKELKINKESPVVTPRKYEREELIFEVIDVGTEEFSPRNAIPFELKKAVALRKGTHLSHYLSELATKDWGDGQDCASFEEFLSPNHSDKNSGLIFCPHRTSVFGVEEVHRRLLEDFQGLNSYTDIYAGSLDKDNLGDSKLTDIQERFKKDKITLLVATNAFGMGIDKPNIRFTVHFSMPQSIESFYQEAGRAGRDREKAYCAILYSPTEFQEKGGGDGDTMTVDRSLMYSFFNNAFPGIENERSVINELLRNIRPASRRTLDSLSRYIEDMDLQVRSSLSPRQNPNSLYIKKVRGGKYGHINLLDESFHPAEAVNTRETEPEEATEILRSIYQRLQCHMPNGMSMVEWLTSNEEFSPGIETLLRDLTPDNPPTPVTIDFNNYIIDDISSDLKTIDNIWTPEMVHDANEYSYTPDQFLENLAREYRRKKYTDFQISDTQKSKVKKQFLKIRTNSDTFKAIYRLYLIGLVTDYTHDYGAKTITAYISKKPDNKYVEKLQEYIGKYVSDEDRQRIPEKIYKQAGDTVIQKCCNYLMEFVYLSIAKKRREAINVMERAIKIGCSDNKQFAEHINTYFDSKYIPELRKYRTNYTIDNLWETLDIIKGEPDSLKHLMGACDRLMPENPDNGMFRLLRAYAAVMRPQYDAGEVRTDLQQGWRLFGEQLRWSKDDYFTVFTKYVEVVREYSGPAAEFFDCVILEDHLEWLISFNKNFLN